ncbi:MAG: hypothetical protein LBI43_06125 [Streptococcaceae bacterium]|jgi:cytoskeletal protein RodZ|nr:hypothetical protein [Streptococcaceae bacterium]
MDSEEFERLKTLFELGVISQKEFDEEKKNLALHESEANNRISSKDTSQGSNNRKIQAWIMTIIILVVILLSVGAIILIQHQQNLLQQKQLTISLSRSKSESESKDKEKTSRSISISKSLNSSRALASSREVATDPEKMSDAKIDQSLMAMSTQERAALIIFGWPKNLKLTTLGPSTTDVNSLISKKFLAQDFVNYSDNEQISYTFSDISLSGNKDGQTFELENLNPEPIGIGGAGGFVGFKRSGDLVIYGDFGMNNYSNIYATESMRSLYREYIKDPRLGELAMEIVLK